MTATSASENDGMFQEVFLLGVCKKGGTEVQFAATATNELTFGGGDKEGEGVVMGNGGRKWKRTPEGDYEIGFKVHPLTLLSTAGDNVLQYFNGTTDASAPFSSTNSRTRDLFRVVVMFTDDPNCAVASTATVTGYASYRITYLDARLVSCTPAFDGVFTHEVKFKIPAYDSAGTGRKTDESVTSQTSNLPALSAYS